MPYKYTDTEDEIVAKLQAGLDAEQYVAMALPEKEKNFQLPANKCLIVVAFSESQFDTPNAVDLVRQTERVTVLLNIRAAKLRGNASINEAIQLLKVLLVGFKTNSLDKLYLQKIEFEDRDAQENYFSYNMHFIGKKLNMEVAEDEQGPLLKKITLINSGDFYNPDYTGDDFVVQNTLAEVESTTP